MSKMQLISISVEVETETGKILVSSTKNSNSPIEVRNFINEANLSLRAKYNYDNDLKKIIKPYLTGVQWCNVKIEESDFELIKIIKSLTDENKILNEKTADLEKKLNDKNDIEF